MPPTSVYVGGLGYDVKKEDLENEFSKFGTLNKVWIARNPPGFAFIEFEDDQDADAAIKDMNGSFIKGCQIRVDLSRGGVKGRGYGRDRGRGAFDSGVRGRDQGSYLRDGRGGNRVGYKRSYNETSSNYQNSDFRSRSPLGHESSWNFTSAEQELNFADYPHNQAKGGIRSQNPDYIDFEDLDYTELFNRYWYDSSLADAKKDEEQFSKTVSEGKSFADASSQTEIDISTFQNFEIASIKNSIENIKREFVKIREILDKDINDNKFKEVQKPSSVETQIVKKYKSYRNDKNLISIL